MPEWPTAFGAPTGRAVMRAEPGDFRVREIMTVEPDGEGEHLWLEVRKTGWNTEDVAQWLARAAKLPRRAVGFSGLKDRRAVTEQWFSLHLPGRENPVLEPPSGVELLTRRRHRRKLNRGTHRANAFRLRLRDWQGDREALQARLDTLSRRGVPNYFGPQRFGHGDANLTRARAWLTGAGEAPRKRSLRGIWLSAMRAGLFNRVLAERVRRDCWDSLLAGDLLQPDGSRGLFREEDEPRAAERLAAGEVHPTAPLPGAGGMASSRACAALEAQALAGEDRVIQALADEGVEAARRATRLPVTALSHEWADGDLWLTFQLPAGAYATMVLAELLSVDND